MEKIKKGHNFGEWRLKKSLGAGGNGHVWLAENSGRENAAIKILTNFEGKSKAKVYARFKNEVQVVQENRDIEGLLPIIDLYLPDEIEDEYPWYVMPVATPLTAYLNNTNFEVAIQVIIEVGKILAKLHERGISHRDIKPANILVWDERICIADFGLVDYPEKLDLTSTGEQIGARWTIAPEMRRDSTNADGKPADVYSLAKTLWILLTGNMYGFDGQYNPESINGLSRINLTESETLGSGYFSGQAPRVYIGLLDDLLKTSTDDAPSQRPTMSQFVEQLSLWDSTYRVLRKRNPLEWRDIQTKLFPTALPQRAVWGNIDSIVEILNYLGSVDHLNHIFLPDRGFVDLRGAQRGNEPDTIELIVGDRTVYLVKPNRLIFESFSFDWEWNYFLLETGKLEATDIGDRYKSFEYLYEISPLQYVSESDWDLDREDERLYPDEYRCIYRYFGGDFLILQRSSVYAGSPSTEDGRHNQMGAETFRQYISAKVQLVQQLKQDKQFIQIVGEKGWTIDEAICSYLNDIFRQEFLQGLRRKRLKLQQRSSLGEEE